MNKVVFLDRDGVINKKREDYVKSSNELIILPNVKKSIKELKKNGFNIIIITNQSPINRGIISKNELKKIHEEMILKINEGLTLDMIYYCPHRPDEKCECRKPKPGMLLQAIKDWEVDIEKSWLIGDFESDVQAGKAVGIKSIRIKENEDLLKAVNRIKNGI